MEISPDALYENLVKDTAHLVSEEDLHLPLWPDATFNEAAAYSVRKSLLKKFEGKQDDRCDSAALLKFLNVNKKLEGWKLALETTWDEVLLGELKRSLYGFWFTDAVTPLVDHHYDVLAESTVGPGAAIGARGGDFYTKLFDSPLSCSNPNLYFWYRRYIGGFPEWKQAEWNRAANHGQDHVVEGNRLSFVPKNDEISRTICVEPSLNMLFQQGLGRILERRVKEVYGIDLSVQQFKNRYLARVGSTFDHLVTIDLESASDSISFEMLRHVLPRGFASFLEAYRSPRTELPGLGYCTPNMVSTMGNGFTFPLQTMLFSAIVLAAFSAREVKALRPRGQCWGNFAVNGDDIIVPREIAGDVFRLLYLLGFTINSQKTFAEGPFRESCGGDYFQGRNLRGVYVKSLATEQDRYAVLNGLNLFSARTGLQLPHTVRHLLKTVKWLPVPRWEDPSSGIQMPIDLARPHLAVCKETQSLLYRCWVPRDSRIRVSEQAIVVPKGVKPRLYNPSGLFLSFLQQSVNSCGIGIRVDRPIYRRKRRVAPNWDGIIPGNALVSPLVSEGLSGTRWNTACYVNLLG